MMTTRRDLALYLASLSVLAVGGSPALAKEAAGQTPDHVHDMSHFPPHWTGSEKIAFLLYPGFTALDVVGPHYMLASLMGAKVWLVAKSPSVIESDLKLAIQATSDFASCPTDLDILCVPGGTEGTLSAMRDVETVAFLKDRGSRAKYVTSVCTGAMLLGAAGLLRGYKATAHWVVRDVLRDFGAEPVDARVVIDRNRITGAGVTAGIDFGLEIVARQRDETYAKAMQLLAEYAPEPRFQAGTPQGAGPEVTGMMAGMLDKLVQDFRGIAQATP